MGRTRRKGTAAVPPTGDDGQRCRRPSTDVTVVGNGGLVFAGFAPILARMVVQQGVRGAMKLPWASTQPSAAAGAEGSDITVSTLVLSNAEFLPKSIASAYELTSSLEASDDGTL